MDFEETRDSWAKDKAIVITHSNSDSQTMVFAPASYDSNPTELYSEGQVMPALTVGYVTEDKSRL